MVKQKNGLVEFGIGVASYVIMESLGTTIHKMEKEGKLNKKEGQKMMQDAMSKYHVASAKYGSEARMQIDNIVKASPFATKKEIDALNAKIDRLMALSQKAKVKRVSKKHSRKARK